ncbi:MAG TPA: hypothetical protein VFE53_04915 [Mucilaginibacter sp.]|jgi:hypothetical protein|nr:hypothetical protein [Mucilaginibacter sp.]
MTAKEFETTLLDAGFSEGTVRYGLAEFERGDHPLFFVRQWAIRDYDRLFLQMKFETNGIDIRFKDGHAGLLRVPLEHQVIGGLDTIALEKRIETVNWSYDYPFLIGELPENKQIAECGQITVPGILNDLTSLYTDSAVGKQLAEELLIRHIAWQYSDDRNDPLHALIDQKYYAKMELDRIVSFDTCYEKLAQCAIPEVDMTQPVGNFIQRHLSYYSHISKIPIIMNLNNLQDLKSEIKDLGFSPKVAEEMEQNMKSQASYFTLKDRLPGDNNNGVDMTLHFRKSNESEYYSFNKFEAVAGKIPPAVENQQYMVLTENKDNPERPLVRQFESGNDAVEFFKKQKGTSELALGESPESRQLLASKETGKVNFVNPDFKQAYFSSAIKQTFYVKNGVGFSAPQAANMVQHRTVHRDNMLNPNNGEAYKAWISLDFDQKKDDYGNYKFKQMNDPNFGFNLEKTLDNFKIKELADPAKKEAIMEAMKNGDRLQLTITGKDNKEHTVQVEAVPRYKTLDFFNSKGEKMKREPFLKPAINKDLGKDKGKGKGKDEGEDLGIAV